MENSLRVLSQDSFMREVNTFSGRAPTWRDQDADAEKGYTGVHVFPNEKGNTIGSDLTIPTPPALPVLDTPSRFSVHIICKD